jgi:hypothetical protein
MPQRYFTLGHNLDIQGFILGSLSVIKFKFCSIAPNSIASFFWLMNYVTIVAYSVMLCYHVP